MSNKKQQPIGICDLCLATILQSEWYTSKGKPRLYCSIDCKNASNSRAGAPIRSQKAKERVNRGEWQNPAHLNPPSGQEQARRARLGRKREVAAGTWRNPALSDEARRKLSRSRKHSGVLHQAIERLKQGVKVKDLTPEEQEAHRQYRRELAGLRRVEINAYYRARYRRLHPRKSDSPGKSSQ